MKPRITNASIRRVDLASSVDRQREAAMRLRECLREAKDGNYYVGGWYSYVKKWDVETLIAGILGEEDEAS